MDKLKVAMIGCGGIRSQHISGIFDEAPEATISLFSMDTEEV